MTYCAWIYWQYSGPSASYAAALDASDAAMVWFIYLPLTRLVLLRGHHEKKGAITATEPATEERTVIASDCR